MKVNAIELERQIDNGFENTETLITDLFEFIESVVYAVETQNAEQINELVAQWRSDEVIDPEIDEDLDLEDDDDSICNDDED